MTRPDIGDDDATGANDGSRANDTGSVNGESRSNAAGGVNGESRTNAAGGATDGSRVNAASRANAAGGPNDATGTDDRRTERLLRARALLAEYRLYVLIGLVLVVALGGWLTYGAYVEPGEETEQRVTDAWSMTGEFGHEAEVVAENSVYDPDSVIADEPVYYTALSPTARGEFTVAYDATAGEDVTVSVTPELVYRSSDDETTYWEQRRPLEGTTETGVIPDERVTTRFDLDVADLQQRIDEIESELGASPGETEAFVAVAVEIDGRIDGQQRSIVERYQIPLGLDGDTYAFDAAGSYEERFEETETVTTASSPPATRAVGGPLLVLVGVVGLAGLVVSSRRFGSPTAAEREWLEYRADRREFGELVTVTLLPAVVRDRPRAPVSSFEQLARLAIDLDAPLFEDRAEERYLVPYEELLYEYDPPSIGGESAGTTVELPVVDSAERDARDGSDGVVTFGEPPDGSGDQSPRTTDEAGGDPAADESARVPDEERTRSGPDRQPRATDDGGDRPAGDDADERAEYVDRPPRGDDA